MTCWRLAGGMAALAFFAAPVSEAAQPSLISHRFASSESASDCSVVVDQQTRLMWARCSLGQVWNGESCSGRPAKLQWDEALRVQVDLCGFTDWHLPSLQELEDLILEGGIPAIDTLVFPGTPPSSFWTASVSTANPQQAWYVNFGKGGANHMYKDSRFCVRLVREAK